MKVTITLPPHLAAVLRAMSEATRRAADELVMAEVESTLEQWSDPVEFMHWAEVYIRDDESDAREFVGRMASAFSAATGDSLQPGHLELLRERLDGEIDEEDEVLLRQAMRATAQGQ